jgi:hypothetical protein
MSDKAEANGLRQLFCNHEFQKVSSYKKDVDDTIGYKLADIVIIYCPKCKKQKEVLLHEYEAIMNKQRLDKEYKQNDNEGSKGC